MSKTIKILQNIYKTTKFEPLEFRISTCTLRNNAAHRDCEVKTIHNLNILKLFPKRFSQIAGINCWKCGKERKSASDLFCDKCNIIQKPHEEKNYFKVLDVPEHFEVDLKELTQKFRNMQSLLHPDKFSNRSEEEKDISDTYSSLVNKAYNTLQTPLKRAVHMLHLHQENIDEKNEITDKEFLMEIMERNEEIDEADTPEKLKQLYHTNKEMLTKIANEISKSFSNNEIIKAKDSIIKMKYYDSVHTRINNLLRERGIVD